MAIQVRKTSPGLTGVLVTAVNALRRLLASTSGVVHGDVTSVTTGDFFAYRAAPATFVSPAPTDLPSLLLFLGELSGRQLAHLSDALAHEAVDAANLLPPASPSALADAVAFLNAAKAKWNAHVAKAGVHFTNDTQNVLTAADATDLPTALALAAAYRTAFSAHIQNALFGASIQLVEA